MVRWSDLGASLPASARVLLRGALWWTVLRRLLLSRVAFGYALAAFLLLLASRMLFDLTSDGPVPELLVALLLAGPAVLVVASSLLVPYVCWAFAPAVSLLLPDHLPLMAPEEDFEPPFGQYLLWAVPLVMLALLLAVLSFVPALQQGLPRAAWLLAGAALLLLASMTLFTRAALAPYYPGDGIRAFLRATRWQRRLVWLPLTLALAGGSLLALPPALALLRSWPPLAEFPALAPILVTLPLLALAAWLATTSIGAALLACDRLEEEESQLPSSLQGSALTTTIDDQGPRFFSSTRPLLRPQATFPALAQHRGTPRWLTRSLAGVAVLASVAGSLFLARLPLADWVLEHDADYRSAPDALDALHGTSARSLGHILDPGVLEQRLRAGYIMAGCAGNLERAAWLDRLGVTQDIDQLRLVTCAACSGMPEVATWVLAREPDLRVSPVIIATRGDRRRPRTALSCASSANDLPLARALLARGGHPRDLGNRDSAIAVAAGLQHWDMLRLLLQKDPGAAVTATFAGLDAAYARDPHRTALVLPRLLAPASDLRGVDRQGHNLFHWAAMRSDLRLVRLLVERSRPDAVSEALLRPDRQGALPWMYVLRKAEVDGQPLSPDAIELLRLLLPSGADVNAVLRGPLEPGSGDAFPGGWNAGAATLNQPEARAVLGPMLDVGLLPQDPALWWSFTSREQAEQFIRDLSPGQLQRAENPQAPAGSAPRKLSTALADAGWPELASEVEKATGARKALAAKQP